MKENDFVYAEKKDDVLSRDRWYYAWGDNAENWDMDKREW